MVEVCKMQRVTLLLLGFMASCEGLQHLVGYYPLKFSSKANDYSPSKNPAGIISNAQPALGHYGQVGGSYQFTGARSPPSYIYLNESYYLNTRFSITLLVWVFPQGRDGEIISYWKNSNYGVSIALENSRPVFHVNSIDRITKYSVKSKNNLLLNEWSHIAGAYDNESQVAKLYVDGIEVANATATGILELATESPLWLGYLFKGRLSQVWVFKNALSLYKVSQIKDYQKPSSPSLSTAILTPVELLPTSSMTPSNNPFPNTILNPTIIKVPNPTKNTELNPTITRLSYQATIHNTSTVNQSFTYATPAVNQTFQYFTPTVNQTLPLTAFQTEPSDASATVKQNATSASLTFNITPSRTIASQSILGSSISQVQPLRCYESLCQGSMINCSENNLKQRVCEPSDDRCAWVYTRLNSSFQVLYMNCTSSNLCKDTGPSCDLLMKNRDVCCDYLCCDSPLCNKPKYLQGGKSCKRKPDLVAVIYGGIEVIRGHNENITMNATLSYDPDVGIGDYSGMNFTWFYGEITGNYTGLQTATNDSQTGLDESIIRYFGNDSGIEITFNTAPLLLNRTYVVKLVVSKDYRDSSAHQIIQLVKGDPPEIYQRCLVNCGLKVVPQVKLSIQSQCQGSLCSNISSYEWILYEQSSSSANNGIWIRKQHLQLITETPLGSSNIVIKKGSLSGRTNYRLALFVQTTAGLPGMSAYDISTTSAPTGGTCTITPSSGISLKTDFNLTCSNWKSDSIPLSYQFQYQLENGLYSMLFHGFNNTVSSWLPPGNLSENFTVKVKVMITDYVGASAAVTNLSVQVKPSELLRPENISSFLTANDSLLNDVIQDGDLSRAAQIANSVLQTVSQDSTVSLQNKAKIQDFLIKKIISLPVQNLPDLLQSTSVIGSALQVSERVSSNTLESAMSAVGSMTSLLWRTAQLKEVAYIPLVTQSAENLGTCLNSVLKTGAVIASGDFGSGLQEQGVKFVKTAMQTISLVADAVLAVRAPDEGMISIATRELSMTLGRHSLEKLAGLRIEAAGGVFVFPSDSQSLQFTVTAKGYIDTQMLSIPFNPYTWDGTRKRVNSDVLALDLKDETRNVIKVSNLSSDIIIVSSLQPQVIALEKPQYFTKNENLRFHEIDVEFENTLVKLEITPQESTVSLFVYLQYDQRPTTKVHELNATVSKYSRCVWTSSAQDKNEGETECSFSPFEPIEFLAKSPGKYFLGVKISNASLIIPIKRRKRSCFGQGRQKRSCVEVKDPPPTPPRSENVSVVPVYDSRTDYNYTLKVAQESCVHWSEEREMWITDGCQVLSAQLNGYLNCSCNHLTSFGGSLLVKPNPIDFDKVLIEFKKLGETGNVAVIVTVAVVFLIYIFVLVIVRKADKKDKRNNGAPIQLPSASNNLQEFEITVSTGVWRNSGTTARVAIEIYGTTESTGILELSPEEPGAENLLFSRANTDVFVLKVSNPLGTIQGVRIGHDNSGESPSWFLEEIVILDKQFNNSWTFTVNQWFALERGDGRIERTFELTPNQLDFNQKVMKRWWKGLTESHIWVSVAAKPRKSRFTRVQRASCCLSVLLTAMLANAMFYQLDGGTEEVFQIGPLKFSWRQVIIGIESALIVAPINVLIVFLFQKGGERSETSTGRFSKATLLIYLAWFLIICACTVSAVFSVFYSLMWGKSISEKWLSSMLISFSQDVVVTEPVKVFFMAMFVAAIFKRKASRGKGYESIEEPQSSPSKQRLWNLKLSNVEEMRKNQARKQNISQFFVDLFLYLIFIFLLMVVCYGNRNDHRYLMTKSIREGLPKFSTVLNDKEFWRWLNDVFIPGVFVGKWYNGQEENQTMYIGDKHSLLVGMARVRQLRVKSTSCKVLDYMKTTFPTCYEGFSQINEDKTVFHKPGWNPVDNSTSDDELLRLCPKPWRYQNADTAPKWGKFSFYPGGGFVADLGYDTSTGYSIVENLKSYYWLDKQTRVVMMEFAAFNPSVNLLTVVTYFYEVEASGYKVPFTRSNIISLNSTETASNEFYLICILLFIVFILFFLGRECYKLYRQRCRYFKSIWNWVEISQITFSVSAVVMYILQTIRVSATIQKLQQNIYANVSFQEAVVSLEVENATLGILTFIVILKLLRMIRFNSHIAVFSKTLQTSMRLLSSFSFNLFIIFVTFLHFGILIFGNGSEFYSSILKGTYFQLELTLGRVKARPINTLAEANETFGRIFAALLLLSLTILSMNFFIALMNEALFEAKNSVNQSELYDLVDAYDWPRNEERRAFFDVVSNAMKRMKFQQTSTALEETEVTNVALNSNRSKSIHFDLISKAITALGKREVQESVHEKPRNIRRKSLFDRVSSIIQKRRDDSSEGNYRRKMKKKVNFRDDVVKSQLKKLHKTKKDLFHRLDNIMQGYFEEEEKFHIICHEIKTYGSQDDLGNVTVTGTENESFS